MEFAQLSGKTTSFLLQKEPLLLPASVRQEQLVHVGHYLPLRLNNFLLNLENGRVRDLVLDRRHGDVHTVLRDSCF